MSDSTFVYFPGTGGKRIAVNPQQVKMVLEYDGYVHIYFSKDDGINVKTSMEDAVRILGGGETMPPDAVHVTAKPAESRRRLMGIL